MWRRAEFIKCPLQFWVNLWVFGIKMTVYTYRIAWYRSFFNFSFVINKINEILLHQKYIKIIVKNCSKWPVFRVIFLRFINEILMKSKCWRTYALSKFAYEKRKFEPFLVETLKFLFFINKLLEGITPSKLGLFWHVRTVLKSLFRELQDGKKIKWGLIEKIQ